jgi:hypothetical protein
MGSILGKLGLWKDPNEDKPVVKPETKKQSVAQSPGSIQTSTGLDFVSETPTGVSGVKKQEIVDYFKKVLEDNNIAGPDYQEFAIALDEMKSQPMDEGTKVKTIFMSFKAMKVTPAKLIETANQYKTLFKQKLDAFDAELAGSFNEHVETKKAEANALITKNTEIDAQMKILNEQRLANEEKFKNLNIEAQNNAAELTTSKNDWHTTYGELVGEIDKHIDLISKHLS